MVKLHKAMPWAYLLLPIAVFLHAVWGTLFWYQFLLAESGAGADSITNAYQLGRLDLISLILASFGIILAIIAISWFNYIRTEAKNEAREEIRDCGAAIIQKYLDDNPDVILDAIQNAKLMQSSLSKLKEEIGADIANRIAKSMGNGNGNDDE